MRTLGKRNLAVRIAIVSSNNLVRVGLRRIFEGLHGIVLVGESYGGVSARHLVEQERPDVILVDLEPDMKLAEVISNFRRPAPLSRIIVLSGWDEIYCARQALAAGANGIVMKCQPPSVLLATVECVAKSLAAPVSATSIPVLINDKRDKPFVDKVVAEPTRWIGSLTDRERAVIALVG